MIYFKLFPSIIGVKKNYSYVAMKNVQLKIKRSTINKRLNVCQLFVKGTRSIIKTSVSNLSAFFNVISFFLLV